MAVYVACWVGVCLIALDLILTEPGAYGFIRREYLRSLARPWKLATFAVAALALVLVAPYTGDPTWDYVDAAFMAVLTFWTAPWSVGTLYRERRLTRRSFVALCLWVFSASWSYDLYLLIRDGYYPVTWLANMLASSVLYVCGGLLWNLDWRLGRGLMFAFTEPDWPSSIDAAPFLRVVWPALLFILLVGLFIGVLLL